MDTRAGKAALQGSIVHRVLEIMAKRQKRGKNNIDPMLLLDRTWDKLTKKSPHIEIRRVTTRIDKSTGEFKECADFKKCRIALETILNDPYYNPYNLKVLSGEQWFALEMPKEEFQCLDKFVVRGYIDLVHEIDEDTIEIVDWKTGNRKNFYTQEPINEVTLMKEIQPRLYHLAAYFLYPQYKNILITFFYANEGGPVTIALSQDNLTMTIASLHKFFTTVKKDTLIRRNRSWRCKNMCSFSKNDICTKVWSDICTMGSEYCENRYGNLTCDEQLVIGKK
jgi:ATP-dependent exoDNAse (exonuclease V) beta subunit